MDRRVILYIRWSSGKQRQGSSLERQLEDGRAYCVARGWRIVDEIIDDGRSAFHGAHRNGGDLGVFETEAKRGEHAGITLLCERLDRLSREDPEEGYDFIRSLTRVGVSVATIDGDAIYEAGAPLNMIEIITLLIKFQTANEESVKKAERSKANWKIKHRRAAEEGRALTKRCPSWLRVVDGRYEVIEEKAATLLRIFAMADAGEGSTSICKTFVAEGIPPVGTAAAWQRERIVEFLRDRRLIGEHVVNDTVIRLFPSIVPVDLFERVCANAEARAKASPKRSVRVANLFASLCRCSTCNGPMKFCNNAEGGHLRCMRSFSGTCVSKAKCVAYRPFEKAVLDSCLHLALDDNAFSKNAEVARLNTTIAERERGLRDLVEEARRSWDAAVRTGSVMAEEQAMAKEAEANAVTANLKNLKAQREKAKGRASNLEHMARVADMRDHLADDITLRKRVAQAMQGLITQVFFAEDGTATLVLAGGLKALQIRHGKVIREGDCAGSGAVLIFAGKRDARAVPAVVKRLLRDENRVGRGKTSIHNADDLDLTA